MCYLNRLSRWLLELLALLSVLVISVLSLSGLAGWFDLSFTQASKIAAAAILVLGVWIEPWARYYLATPRHPRR